MEVDTLMRNSKSGRHSAMHSRYSSYILELWVIGVISKTYISVKIRPKHGQLSTGKYTWEYSVEILFSRTHTIETL